MRIVRHRWIPQVSFVNIISKCKYCGCERCVNFSANRYSNKYIYSNNYYNRLYRAPECKRIYLGDKVL
jgi:hypothetical protein